MSTTTAVKTALCLAPTGNGPCWRKANHHGKHIRQHPTRDSHSAPILAVAEDGVVGASASRGMAQLVHDYATASGCHVVDLDTYATA